MSMERTFCSRSSRSYDGSTPDSIAMISPVVSSAHPTMSSNSFVECGSEVHWSKKKSTKSGQSARQWPRLYLSQPSGLLTGSNI